MRILIVSYHLHPDVTAEGICVAKAARALKDAGHDVAILTSTHNRIKGSYSVPTTPFLRDIPVHRVEADPRLLPAWSQIFYGFARIPVGNEWIKRRLLGRASAIPNLVLGSSEQEYPWVAAAARKIVQLCAATEFDVIHSRLNHNASHLAVLAALTRLRTHVPWSAHFSDPWPHHLYPDGYKSDVGALARLRSEAILDRILKRADSLTFPSERLLRHMLSGPREKYRQKALAVPHLGNFWVDGPSYSRDDKFKIVFTGLILKQRNPENFFKALRSFLNLHSVPEKIADVQFIGHNSKLINDAAGRYELHGVVTAKPYCSFEDLWGATRQADVLLLLESPMKEGIFMPSKLADSLSAGRPILALSPAIGTVSDFLSDGGGIRVGPDELDKIENALSDLYQRWQTNRLDELIPSKLLIDRVSPSAVVPVYEAAFRGAVAGARLEPYS